jgi:hypothetical protein
VFFGILFIKGVRVLFFELIELTAFSSITTDFGDTLDANGSTKAKFHILNFLNFHPILMHSFLQNDYLDGP